MKSLLISLLIIFSITGCQDSSRHKASKDNLSLMGSYRDGVNPNSLAYRLADKQKDRENSIKISNIDSNTKIEIAKIESGNKLLIAKVHANTTKEIAQTDSITKIQTSKIDALTKKDNVQNQFYITMAVVIVFLIALFLLYLNNKKNRELKNRLHQDKLNHERLLKEREHDEKRLHKMLDLVGKGKLSSEMEEEILISLTKPESKLLET